jgi:hypothetical protein
MNQRLYIDADEIFELELNAAMEQIKKTLVAAQKPGFMLTQHTDSQINDVVATFCHEVNAEKIKRAFALYLEGKTSEAMGIYGLMMHMAIGYAANETVEKAT